MIGVSSGGIFIGPYLQSRFGEYQPRMPVNMADFTRMLLPSGNDYEACAIALEQKYGIQMPTFAPRSLVAGQNERLFIRVRSRDIPELLAKGYADAGVLYSDIIK